MRPLKEENNSSRPTHNTEPQVAFSQDAGQCAVTKQQLHIWNRTNSTSQTGGGENCDSMYASGVQGDSGYDAIVVGSGYGGSVAACRLAQAGLKVCILEKGRRWETPNFPDSFWQSLRNTTFNTPIGTLGSESGLYHVHLGGDCMAVTAAGVGGGSLISAGVMVRTPRRTRKDPRWPKEWENDWSKYESLSQEMLEPELVPHSFPKKKIMDVIAKDEIEDLDESLSSNSTGIKIGVRFNDVINKAGVRQGPCVACGNCIVGCNFNAKSSTDKNYLAVAVQAGAHVRTQSKVLFIAENPRELVSDWLKRNGAAGDCNCRIWSLSGQKYETAETNGPESPINTTNVSAGRRWRVYLDEVSFLTADIVILGAGVLGTNEILLRSRQRGLNLSQRLGKGVSCNGNNIGFASGSPAPLQGYGIGSSTFASTSVSQRPGPSICSSYTSSAGYTIQAAVYPKNLPYLCLRLWTYGSDKEWYVPSVLWAQVKVWARTRCSSFMVLNMIGYDESDGEISLDRSTGRLRLLAPHDSNMVKKISACQRLANRIRARLYVSRFRSTAVHLLGGCGAADDPWHGVVNPDGQVFDPVAAPFDGAHYDAGRHKPSAGSHDVHPGLFVCDGSLLPFSVGVNPSATITTLAERVAAAAVRDAKQRLKSTAAQVNHPCECDRQDRHLVPETRHLVMPCQNGTMFSPQPAEPSLQDRTQRAPVSVRERLCGRLAGLPCELNVVMHLGIMDDCSHSRSFGDSHRLLRGSVTGAMHLSSGNQKLLQIIDGNVDMCWINERTPYTQYMHYHLVLASATGVRYVLTGKKELCSYLGLVNAWAEATTLLVKFQQVTTEMARPDLHRSEISAPDEEQKEQQPNVYPVLEGLLTVSLHDNLKSLITLEGTHRLSFVRFLIETLIRTYILRTPRVLTSRSDAERSLPPPKELCPSATDAEGSYVDHVVHELITDDGLKVSARQWLCVDKSDKPTSSNVVLLVNGHSTECFWLPTEPTDVVRILSQNGYEPWLLYTRLMPLHISDRPFSLDHVAKFDIPAVIRKIEEVRGDALPVHAIGHSVGGLCIHMAILGGYVHSSRIASILCTNSSMYFQVTNLAKAKIISPLLPVAMTLLGEKTTFSMKSKSDDNFRHRLVRRLAQLVPRPERCTDDDCNTFSGLFGNVFWHSNVTLSLHSEFTPKVFPLCAWWHIRKIISKGHVVDAAGQDVYMAHPERLSLPTTYISGGKELLVTEKTGRLGYEFMSRHHPQFVHTHKLVPGYGHSDLVLGETAYRDVYPLILEHLGRVRTGLHHISDLMPKSTTDLQERGEESSRNNSSIRHLLLGVLFVIIQAFFVYMTNRMYHRYSTASQQ